MSNFRPFGPAAEMRWIPFFNADSQAAPAHGVMRLSGSRIFDSQNVVGEMKRPDVHGCSGWHVNGPVEVPAGGYGVCTRDYPALALYEGSTPPQAGQMWGPAKDGWALKKDYPGGFVSGSPDSQRVQVMALSQRYPFKLQAQLTAGQQANGLALSWSGSAYTEPSGGCVVQITDKLGSFPANLNDKIFAEFNEFSRLWEPALMLPLVLYHFTLQGSLGPNGQAQASVYWTSAPVSEQSITVAERLNCTTTKAAGLQGLALGYPGATPKTVIRMCC